VDNSPAANDDLDRKLVRRFLDGERAAGDELVNRFHRSVFNVALRMLGNVQDAEDVTQTAFGNAFAALERYDPKFRVFSWIYRMTVNESLNTLKRHRDVVSLDGTCDVPAPAGTSWPNLAPTPRRARCAARHVSHPRRPCHAPASSTGTANTPTGQA
jgi:RNA polymerase sigma-70 factor (ECF subfamily)